MILPHQSARAPAPAETICVDADVPDLTVQEMPESIYTCKFPGCTRQYASTDGVRKHCRKSHAEWLREVDLEKANSGCRWAAYCTRQTITDGHDPRTTPVGCKRAREIMADGGLLPPLAGTGTALLKERGDKQQRSSGSSDGTILGGSSIGNGLGNHGTVNVGYGIAMDGKSRLQVTRPPSDRRASSENILPPEMISLPDHHNSPLPQTSSLTPNAQQRQRLGEFADTESSALLGSSGTNSPSGFMCPDSSAAPPQPTGFFVAWGMPPLKRGLSLGDTREASVLAATNAPSPLLEVSCPAPEDNFESNSQVGTPLGLVTPSSFLDSIIA